MGTDISQQRITETRTGRAACLLLALVWFVSMGVADANAYSYVPLLGGIFVVILLALSAMIRGSKVVRLSGTAWISLFIGTYFLARCLCSFSVVEARLEASIILGCAVYYVAGIYAAHGRTLKSVIVLTIIAAALNLLYFLLMQGTSIPMEWTGRPSVGPGSVNHRPITLFVYKNHAAAFLSMVGMLLIAVSLWVKKTLLNRAFPGLLGLVCVIISTYCHSRSPYFIIPVLLIGGWILWVVLRLYTDDKLGWGLILSGFAILGFIGTAFCLFLFDPKYLHLIADIDSHNRFEIWRETCRLLPETPPWGHGAHSLQWLILSLPNLNLPFLALPNYAHNEYLQVWVDYGWIGLSGLVAIVGLHLYRGFTIMASEAVPSRQRVLTALALLALIGWSACSMIDFFWHHYAIAAMTAFSAGITASPYAYNNPRKNLRRTVSVQSTVGKAVLAFIGAAAALCALRLSYLSTPAWSAQWEFNRLSLPGADTRGQERHAILAKLVKTYPATELMDQYFRIPLERADYKAEECLLRHVLNANPKQIYTATMLGELLSRQGRYEEAEETYRRYLPSHGRSSRYLGDLARFYALNILRRGQYLWANGNLPMAYSLLKYGLNVAHETPGSWTINSVYCAQDYADLFNRTFMPQWKAYIEAREQDVAVLQLLHVATDDSWQQPDEESGNPALYWEQGAPERHKRETSHNSSSGKDKKE